ncbi:hypothetical protein Cs7R123_74190 [Catellatospora sp. TT07R-123]|uniref:MFS transporter n=1 Tax=Catellatospora sp. TT07R-123 TaxID=2733863 RepID=UPI001B1DA024|nr:MFS transporter [Catellatospora sp. TT07R-123]GHJ50077.1 hypothetical protein Cs7R123_74190 [Catellatospora sp. TT07R-123]
MSAVLETAAPPDTDPPAYRWRWPALFVVLAAEVMDLLDSLVTTIAGPSIRADVGGTESLIQWLGAAYTLAMAVGLITGGRLGDLYGRKRMFMIGSAGFVAASVLCAVSTSPELLIGARVLQGLFGAVLLPQGLGMIKEMFPPKEMGAAFGAFGPVMGLSAVAGPILAGWLVDADYWGTGWRMIFLINLPLGLLALIGAAKFLPESRSSHASKLDLTGVGLVTAGALLLLYPLVQGRELGWPTWTFVMMASCLPVFALFVRQQAVRRRNGGDPLVEPSLFRQRSFSGGLVAGLAFFSGMIGFGLAFSMYVQLGLGYSPLKAGLASVPQSLGIMIGFGLASGAGLTRRLGRSLLHVGLAVMAAATVGFVFTLEIAGFDVTPWQLAPALGTFGLGMGLVMAPFFDIILAGVQPHETGSASGTLTAVQQLGGAVGIALLGTLFFNTVQFGQFGPDQASFAEAMRLVLWVEVGLIAVTFAAAFLLPRQAREEELAH